MIDVSRVARRQGRGYPPSDWLVFAVVLVALWWTVIADKEWSVWACGGGRCWNTDEHGAPYLFRSWSDCANALDALKPFLATYQAMGIKPVCKVNVPLFGWQEVPQ